jgi:hypothetical protein
MAITRKTLHPGGIFTTRYPELGYRREAPGLWHIYDLTTLRPVGPQYGSQKELLADLDRYAAIFGCR